MPQGYIDTASVYEVVAALTLPPDEMYPWALSSSLIVTMALVRANHLTLAPAPVNGTSASGVFGVLTDGLSKSRIMTFREPAPIRVSDRALLKVKAWATSNPGQLRDALEKLLSDEENFQPWLRRCVRDAWMEHSSRLGGIFDECFLLEIAKVLDVKPNELGKLRLMSLRPEVLSRYSARQSEHDEAFTLTRDAYVVSNILRGQFHELVAKTMRWDLLRHPYRLLGERVNAIEWSTISETDVLFAYLILGSALRSSSDPTCRVAAWTETVVKARDAWANGQLSLPVMDTRHDVEAVAVEAALGLGLAAPPQWISKVIDTGMGLGVGALTLRLGELAALCLGSATTLASVWAEPSRRSVERLRRSNIEKLMTAAPRAIDTGALFLQQ